MSEYTTIFPVENATEEERLYFKLIDEAQAAGKKELISNSRAEHAVYLLYKLLEAADHSVKIYSGNLARHFGNVLAYGESKVAEAAVAFLRREDSELSIITVEDLDVDKGQTPSEHPLLVEIAKSEVQGQVVLARGNQEDWNNFKYHFIVADDKSVRVEYDTNNLKAFVNFGDSELAKKLGGFFDFLMERSEEQLKIPA